MNTFIILFHRNQYFSKSCFVDKYDAGNRLISYNEKEVQYDKDGNMTCGPLDGEMVSYEYDCRNRLVKTGDTQYEYDAENNRIAVETEAYREEYVVNTNVKLSQTLTATRYEKNPVSRGRVGADTDSGYSSKGVTTTYTYGNGLVSQYTDENGAEYYHYNNIGSTMYLTKNGVKTHEFAYSTYGELTLGEYGEVRFLYNGQLGVMTDESGLYYMRARYYNPEIRRFINQDILTGSIENSQSLNRYTYCQGNPVNYFDPFGLEPCEFFTGLGHGMLNLMGLIPGIGDVFDITNAIWYASEGNWGRCFEAGIAALPFIGNLLPDRRSCDYVRRALNIASYGGTGFLAGQGMIDGGQALWSEINSGQCSGWNIFLGIANIGLNGATLFFSGKGFVQETGNLNKMLKADGVYDSFNNLNENGVNINAQSPMFGDDWHRYFNETYGSNNVMWESASIKDIIDMPSKIIDFSPQQVAKMAQSAGWTVGALGKGKFVGIPFEQGGGFSMHAPNGGSEYIQYHPGGGHHGDLPYFKISSGPNGIVRFFIGGNEQ